MLKRTTQLCLFLSCACLEIRCLHLPAVIMRRCIALTLCGIFGICHDLSAICSCCSVANLNVYTLKALQNFCACKLYLIETVGSCASSHFPHFFTFATVSGENLFFCSIFKVFWLQKPSVTLVDLRPTVIAIPLGQHSN